ncbi:class I SAM-dependent methyltransferase [Candidatus Bathyarchaeota archaeon]|nr:MAG: class I SAM-dependent methyltransferase [Candidatus Bathyarchaeota archaeon]
MELNETIRRQWNKGAKSWVEFVRSGRDYYKEHLNGPALKRMVGNVRGKRVLDVGCGEGYFSRVFARMGAEVTGIDISEALIEAAREEEREHPLGVKYFVADAADLGMLESESFDIAFCHMALSDIADYEGAIAEVSRILKVEGRFVIVMEHPCFSTRFMEGKKVSGWEIRLGRDGSKEYLYYRVEDYLRRHSYTWEWKHDRLPYSFVTTGFHRTLSDYVNTLTKNGLVITRLDEPQPLEEGVRIHPPLRKHYRVPFSLVIEATKIPWRLRSGD